ncbi:MAG: twin-arginine translocase subunit TatC [Thermoguttaceae bacterium]
MTFGEHLGELRGCLLRSIYGLILGFIVGLAVGNPVVAFIQRPLNRALATYYEHDTAERIHREVGRLDHAQMERLVQAELEKARQAGGQERLTRDEARKRVESQLNQRVENKVRTRVKEEHLLAEEVYVDPREMLDELKKAYPDQFKTVNGLSAERSSDAGDPKGLMRMLLWHRSADDSRLQSRGLNPLEGFAVYVKASLLVGMLLASPWIFYQIWSFVAAGLYPHERRYVRIYLPFSIALFLAGAALAFFVVFGPVLDFLLSFNRSMTITPEARINEWLSFVWVLPAGFGIGFQLPLVMLFLERIGVLTVASYLSQWKIAVLVIVVVAGILMPPDPYSMILMAGSLTALYFGGVLLCKMLPRRSSEWK